jgi:hypothetical protein
LVGDGGVCASIISVGSRTFGGKGAGDGSVTAAGLLSHFISEDCGISRWHHGRVVVGRCWR